MGGSGAAEAAEKPHYHGHRERLRARLLAGSGETLADYELVEFLLFAAQPRQDTKPLAKALLARFGSFAGILGAGREALLSVPGMGNASAAALLAVREAAARMLREAVRDRPVLGNFQAVIDYCTARLGFGGQEEFYLLFLDKKNMVIADERQQRGTVDHTPVYPREVVKRALELGASALIMVHNHPSGDVTPSQADIAMTRAVGTAVATVGIALHDHLVLGRGRHASFRSLGLM